MSAEPSQTPIPPRAARRLAVIVTTLSCILYISNMPEYDDNGNDHVFSYLQRKFHQTFNSLTQISEEEAGMIRQYQRKRQNK